MNATHTDGLRVVYVESFSLSVSVKDERVGEGAIVGKRESSVEGVIQWGEERGKSNICRRRENGLGNAMTCFVSGGGITLTGATGEGGSTASEKEEPRFRDEQV